MVSYCVVCQRENEKPFICRNCGTFWRRYLTIRDIEHLTQQKIDQFEKALTGRKVKDDCA